MEINLEKSDNLNAVLEVQIEKEDYHEKVERELKNQRKKAQIKGFRPGMAPPGLIRKLYGKAVLFDELNNIVAEAVSGYIRDEKLNLLGEPMPQPFDIDEEGDKDNFTFRFDVGMAPEFEVSVTKKTKIPLYKIKPDDKMREGFIQNYRQRHGEFRQGDITTLESMITGDIKELQAEGDDGLFVEGASMLVNFVADDHKENFIGKKVGDTIEFDLKETISNEAEISSLLRIPREDAKSIDGTFSFTINEIKNFEPAPMEPAFFKAVFETDEEIDEKQFRERIEKELEDNLQKESEGRFRIDAVEHMVKNTGIELPEEFLKRWLIKNNENLTEEEVMKEFDGFIKGMKWQLIRNKIASENEIKVDQDELVAEAITTTRMQFQQYGLHHVTDEQIEGYAKEMSANEEQARKLADRVLETKVTAWIRENAKAEEKSVTAEQFNKLFE